MINSNKADHFQSNPCFHENNNALEFDTENLSSQPKKSLNRLVRSSTDLDLHSSSNREESHSKNRAIRIESALLTSDYSHSFKHPSRVGAGDENLSTYSTDKQIQTNIRTDHTHYLTLEQIPLTNRRTIPFTSKQLLLISFSVFLLVTLLCLGIISLFF